MEKKFASIVQRVDNSVYRIELRVKCRNVLQEHKIVQVEVDYTDIRNNS